MEFPLHDAAARRNSVQKARLLSKALQAFELALAAEAELAAAREHERTAVRTHRPQATEWMVTVLARGSGVDPEDEEARDAILTRLEHASASIGVAPGCLSVTLTVEASNAADAPRIGELDGPVGTRGLRLRCAF